MSSGKLCKFYNSESVEEIFELDIDISKLVIPFSRLFKKYESSDIYSGKERIPEYKMILRREFHIQNSYL